MIIHFFKERIKERIDFGALIDGYFAVMPNCEIETNDQEVKITKKIPAFNYEYSYLITKRTRVSSIYKLNAAFININLLIDIPVLIPNFISRLIFQEIGEICKNFELEIFCDRFTNIKPFDMYELISELSQERIEYLKAHPEIVTYSLPMNVLNDMCRYQSSIDVIPTLVKGQVYTQKYNIFVDKRDGSVKKAITWKVGDACIFPPHLDFVQIEEENCLVALVPAEVFYHHSLNHMSEIKNPSIDYKLLFLSNHGAWWVKHKLPKIKKSVVSLTNYMEININDIVEC